VAPKTRCGLAG